MHRIHKLHRFLFGKFRKKRWDLFVSEIKPRSSDNIVDVGGAWYTWRDTSIARGKVTVVNKAEFDYHISPEIQENLNVDFESGDALDLKYADKSFQIAYSNSVIEHVGDFAAQQKFASEILRVGEKIWVQTPAREFIIEPHYMALGVHWLPAKVQKKIVRWISIWGWVQSPTQEYIDNMVDEIRLLKKSEMEELFTDCMILEEKVFWIFTKSYIAVRL